MGTTTTTRGPGRPALPADQVQDARRTVRLDATDESLLRALAAHGGTTEADAIRAAIRAHAARVLGG